MKKTHLSCIVIILFFALILMLSGCGAISNEAQITSIINGFSNALSNQNWDKVRSYCFYGSGSYNNVINLENVIAQLSSMIENVTLDYFLLL